MDWLAYAQVPLLAIALWLFTTLITASFPTLQGKRICFLIAHPDDEAMFMSPMLISLTRPALQNKIFVLCLSSGDADGLGHIRKGELVRSALHLGVSSAEHVVVVEDKRFVDSMTTTWEADDIANVLMHYFAPNAAKGKNSRPSASIDVLVTFDQGGVSGHPNHISLFHGAKAFLKSLMKKHAGWDCPVKLYTLSSTSIVRKYSSILDCLGTITYAIVQRKEKGAFPTPLIAVSSPGGVLRAQTAMTTAHKSQMRWFRWGWIGLSRYMVVNDLTRIRV